MSNVKKQHKIVKLITLGDTNAGKSCIIHYFIEKEFINMQNTVGVDFYAKTIDYKGNSIKVQIYDTSGQEKFKTISANYYKRADGILLVFDLTRKETFSNIEFWIKEMKEQMDIDKIGLVLLGNKSDLVEEKQVTPREGNTLAQQLNTKYYETSAKNGNNIDESINYLIDEIIKKKEIDFNEPNDIKNEGNKVVELGGGIPPKKKKCC